MRTFRTTVSLLLILTALFVLMGTGSAASSAITLSPTGTIYINSWVDFSVKFPGADEYCFQMFDPDGNLWANYERTLSSGQDSIEIYTPSKAGTCTFVISGCAGNQYKERTFTLSLKAAGTFANKPTITGANSIYLDENFTGYNLSWKKVSNFNDYYAVWLYGNSGDDRVCIWECDVAGASCEIPLDAFYSNEYWGWNEDCPRFKEYTIEVEAYSEGYLSAISSKVIKNTAYEKDDNIAIYLYQENSIEAGAWQWIGVDAPGAEEIMLFIEGNNFSDSGDYLEYHHRFSTSGTKKIYACARYSSWGDWSPVVERQVTVKSASLQKPTISCEQYVLKGDEQKITITPGKNTSEFYADVYYMPSDDADSDTWSKNRLVNHYWDLHEKTTFTLDTATLDPGRYIIEACAWSENGSEQYAQSNFFVKGRSPEAPSITSVSKTCKLDDEITFTLFAEGASAFIAKENYYNESGDNFYPNEDWIEIEAENGRAEYLTSASLEGLSGGTFTLYARALVDGVWTKAGECSVSVAEAEKLDQPAFKDYNWGESYNLQMGKGLTLTLKNPVAHAEYYEVWVNKVLENEDEENIFDTYETGSAFEIPEKIFAQAGEYVLYVSAMGKGYLSSDNAYYYINVTGSRKPGPEVSFGRRNYSIRDIIEIYAKIVGAERIEFSLRYKTNNKWEDDVDIYEKDAADPSTVLSIALYNDSNCTGMQCRTRAQVNGVYTDYSKWIEVAINPDPAWDGDELHLPASLTEIEDEAFMGSRFRVVHVPENVTSIGSKAFANCKYLMSVVIPNKDTKVASDAFDGCASWLTIWGEKGSYSEQVANDNGINFQEW